MNCVRVCLRNLGKVANLPLVCNTPIQLSHSGRRKLQQYRNVPIDVQYPLSEREPICMVGIGEILDWHHWANNQAKLVGTSLATADGGPTTEELQVELEWLVDDAVATMQEAGEETWKTASWKQLWKWLQLDLGEPMQCKIQMRTDIPSLTNLWKRRIQDRVPIQYLTNCVHWRDLVLAVGPGVLIPRPETEQMIDLAQEALIVNPELKGGPWADLGTGSGALAIGLARMLPEVEVWAVEKSPHARKWAQLNIERCRVASTVKLVAGEWYTPLEHLKGRLCGILSNPPYIEKELLPTLQAEVSLHEPHLALDGGLGNALDSLHSICDGAQDMLCPGGFIALETGGDAQAALVKDMLSQKRCKRNPGAAFVDIHNLRDAYGVARFVTAYRASM